MSVFVLPGGGFEAPAPLQQRLEVIRAGAGGDLPFHPLSQQSGVTGQCQGDCEPPGLSAGGWPLRGAGQHVGGWWVPEGPS